MKYGRIALAGLAATVVALGAASAVDAAAPPKKPKPAASAAPKMPALASLKDARFEVVVAQSDRDPITWRFKSTTAEGDPHLAPRLEALGIQIIPRTKSGAQGAHVDVLTPEEKAGLKAIKKARESRSE